MRPIGHGERRVPLAGRPRRSSTLPFVAGLTGLALVLTACGNGTPAESSTTDDAVDGVSEDPAASVGEPQYGGELTIAITSVPPTIDPYATSLQAAWTTATTVCEALFGVSATYTVEPVLVDSYEYDLDRSYVMTLRSGVSFHDDTPLTADDVIASIERFALTPGSGALLADNLESIEATGDLEVTITLKEPSAIVPTLLTNAYIMPASVQRDASGEPRSITEPANDLVCTGPYRLTSYQPDQEIRMVRWDGYASRSEEPSGATGAKPAYVDEIVLVPIPEASARRQAVETGLADFGGWIPLDSYDLIASSSSSVPVLMNANSSSTLIFNKIEGVMSDVRIRQAFLAALDQTQIMAAGFGRADFYELDGSIVPAINEVWHSDAGLEHYNNPDLELVTELLADAGYDGEPIVWLTTKDDFTWYAPAEPAVQLLKEAGLNIELQVMDQASIIDRRSDPTQYDVFSSAMPTYADPLLIPYLQDSFPGGWTNPEKNELLSRLTSEPEPTVRKEVWDELQELIYTDVPFLKFGTTKPLGAASTRLGFTNPDDLGNAFYSVWLED